MAMKNTDRVISLSCLCVGVGTGGGTSMVARVSVVNYRGEVLLEEYVRPMMHVTDYRTATTGIEAGHLSSPNAKSFSEIQQQVANHIRGKIVVGYTLWNDLSVLGIPHPAVATRDVALYQPFRNAMQSSHQLPGLPTLMWRLMRRRVQEGTLDSVENARAAMDLYRTRADEWEGFISTGRWPSLMPPDTFSRCYT